MKRTRRRVRWIVAVAAAVTLMAGAEALAAGRTVYLEEFDNYSDMTPCFRPGTALRESAGSIKRIEFTPETAGGMRTGFFPITDSPKGKWTLTFLANGVAEKPSDFTLQLYYGDPKRPEIARHPFRVEKGRDRKYWRTFHVFSSDDRRLVGWNIAGEVGTSIEVDRVRVEEGVHRPYRLGDPEEWLAKLPPVKDELLPEDFGEAMKQKKAYPVDLAKNDVLFKYKPRVMRGEKLVFATPDGEKAVPFGFTHDVIVHDDKSKQTLTNAVLTIGGGTTPGFPAIYAAPRLADRYLPGERDQILAARDRFPHLTNRVFDVRLTRNDRGENELWVDGNFCFSFTNAPVVSVSGSPRFRMKESPRTPSALVQPLDFRKWPEGFPLWYVRENIGGRAFGSFRYSCRSCFEAMPSSCLFSVPNRPYVRAKALCRVATDVPDDFEPVVVARLTNYGKGDRAGYGRDAEASTSAEVRLPRPGSDDPLAKGVVKKGENLYEVTFELDPGRIQDLLYRNDALQRRVKIPVGQLDFEFTGVRWRHDTFYADRSEVPDREVQSSVVVLSGELEAAPCDFDVVPNHPFSTYCPDERVGGRYVIRPRRPGKYAIAWTVTDDAGKVVEQGSVGDGLRSKVEVDSGVIDFKVREVGHYNVVYSFTDGGKTLWSHAASFSVVQPNTRQAGYESPYFSWTWLGNHGTCPDYDQTMEMVTKLGIRGTIMSYGGLCETNEQVRKYGVRQAQFKYLAVKPRPGEAWESAVDRVRDQARALVARFPHTKRALIFHESGKGPFPLEIVGGKTEMTDELRQKDAEWVKKAEATARVWREVDPGVKLIFGNSTQAYGLLAHLFRGGIDRSLVDFVGEETLGFSAPPEWDTARVPWTQREIARTFGYEVKNDCPFEWKCRSLRNLPRPEESFASAFMIRDALIAHALGYSTIPLGGGTRSADGYRQSVWGSSTGERWPLAYPGRGVNAIATLTILLDRAKFLRLVPTGSLTVFCEEFETRNGRVYAVWTARGETELALDLGENAAYTTVSLTGTERTGCTETRIAVSDEPRYLLAEKPLAGARAELQRRFANEEIAFARKAVAVPLVRAEEAVQAEGEARRFLWPGNPFRRPGPFAVKTADDPLKGACLELTDLNGTEKTPKSVMNVTFLKFPEARPVEGTYDSIGVWVEGNSGWGKVWFELTDAEGEVWLTSGTGGYDSDVYDWPHRLSFNFDGWHFLTFPLTAGSPVKIGAPGENADQLSRDGSGNGRIDFPVKVTGLGVGNMPWGLDFLEMCPTRGYLRVKEITLLGNKQER